LVNHDGIFDTFGMGYATEELWFTEWENGGTPYDNPREYQRFNPANHVKEWRDPMLVIQGDRDFRVPTTQALSTFTALQRRGIESRLVVFPDENHVTMPTSITPEAMERFERREQVATINAMRSFFYPRAVAVIGASRQRNSVGGALFRNLLDFGFEGPVYPVNINAPVVQSVVAYPTVEAVPGPVDLAVIVVPAARVAEVAEQCGRKGVRALVVISAGFAEVGEEGRARQAELLRICRAYGMRLIGPNCIGIINTDPTVRLNATFGPVPPPAGRVGFASQSGALGLAIIDYARTFDLGLSTFVSMGNKLSLIHISEPTRPY